MTNYDSNHIRNLALLGHVGSGKSALAEALLLKAKALDGGGRQGKEKSVSGFTEQEKQAGHSLEPFLLYFQHNDTLTHIIDTPGYPDFFGRTISILPAVETIVLVISAQQGIESVTRKAFEMLASRNKCGLIVINKCDAPDAKPEQVLTEIQEGFGSHCLPVNLPSADGKSVVDCYFHPDYNSSALFSSVTEAHDRQGKNMITN